jgi:hypothetical protein
MPSEQHSLGHRFAKRGDLDIGWHVGILSHDLMPRKLSCPTRDEVTQKLLTIRRHFS